MKGVQSTVNMKVHYKTIEDAHYTMNMMVLVLKAVNSSKMKIHYKTIECVQHFALSTNYLESMTNCMVDW